MTGFGIYLSQVLSEIRVNGLSNQGPYFNLTYRKADGSFGEKRRVQRRAGEATQTKKDLLSIRTEIRHAGKLHLIDEGGHKFELHIPLVVSFNGKLIDHRF
jgi:hypothetical protein